MSLAVIDQPALPGLELTPVGVTVTGPVDPDAAAILLGQLRRAEAMFSWVVGDLVIAMRAKPEDGGLGPTHGYGLAAAADLRPDHVARCVAIALRIPHERRHANLSWSHHELVAGLEPNHADRLLVMAEDERLTVRTLRAVMDQERADLTPELDLPAPSRLPAPPQSVLRAILAADPESWVLWQPSTGTLRPAEVAA